MKPLKQMPKINHESIFPKSVWLSEPGMWFGLFSDSAGTNGGTHRWFGGKKFWKRKCLKCLEEKSKICKFFRVFLVGI